ncbi:MAG: ABC transporter ATP-binding protein [Tissierellia bacterium]|nr:ABC transporter ATP-binding protein [Tissierellia bacterium]
MIIDVTDLSFGYDERLILKHIDFRIQEPSVIAVVGPNGVGKSTLFKLILGLLRSRDGSIRVFDRSITNLSRRELAKDLAYIPQSHFPTYNYSVLSTVLMGMVGQVGLFSSPSALQKEAAYGALESLGIAHLALRGYAQISGGERQLALIARALVQEAKVLIMDEPTANLDFGNQLMVMERVQMLSKEGYTVLVSLHNPQHAYLYADKSLVLHGGEVLTFGKTREVLDQRTLEKIYRIDINLLDVDNDGERIRVPMPKKRRRIRYEKTEDMGITSGDCSIAERL